MTDLLHENIVRENRGVVVEAVNAQELIYRVRIITAGPGSSAYYPADVIERDLRAASPIGTKSYWNHPTMSEGWERPERDSTLIGAKQVSEVEYDATDQSAYANFQFDKTKREYIEQFFDVLGMSIYMLVESDFGTIGEYTGEIVTRFIPSPLNSVDIVTVAGANGAILQRVSEGYKRLVANGPVKEAATEHTPNTESADMDDAKYAAMLAESNKGLVNDLVASLQTILKPAAPVKESGSLTADVLTLVDDAELPKEARAVVFQAVEAGVDPKEAVAFQKQYVEAILASAPKAEAHTPTNSFGGASFVMEAGKTENSAEQWAAMRASRGGK